MTTRAKSKPEHCSLCGGTLVATTITYGITTSSSWMPPFMGERSGYSSLNAKQAAATVDPAVFAEYVSNGTWTSARHLEHIIEQLRQVAARKLSRLLVFAPPRHGKSDC